MVDETTSIGTYNIIYTIIVSEVSYQHHSGPLGMSFKCKLVCDVIKLKILDCSRLASPLVGSYTNGMCTISAGV